VKYNNIEVLISFCTAVTFVGSPQVRFSIFIMDNLVEQRVCIKRFESIEVIKENSRKELISNPEAAYKKCMDDWINRWRKCIVSEEYYFEDDKINFDD